VIRRIPRLLGPGLNKAGKFPTLIREGDDLSAKQEEAKRMVKFQLKKVACALFSSLLLCVDSCVQVVCMSCPIANVGQTDEQITVNITLAVNFLGECKRAPYPLPSPV
jgi:large subunit ribosomal protein L10Ae